MLWNDKCYFLLICFVLLISSLQCPGAADNGTPDENGDGEISLLEQINDQIEVSKYFLNKVSIEYTNPFTESDLASVSSYYIVHYDAHDHLLKEEFFTNRAMAYYTLFEYYNDYSVKSKKVFDSMNNPTNTWFFYYQSGKKQRTEEYFHNIINMGVEYYETGIVKKEETYNNDGELLKVIGYYENENIKYKELYDNGIPVGWWTFYDEAGREVKADFYDMGSKQKYSNSTWNRTMRMSQEIYELNPETNEFEISIRFEYQYDSNGNLRQGRTTRFTDEGEQIETVTYN